MQPPYFFLLKHQRLSTFLAQISFTNAARVFQYIKPQASFRQQQSYRDDGSQRSYALCLLTIVFCMQCRMKLVKMLFGLVNGFVRLSGCGYVSYLALLKIESAKVTILICYLWQHWFLTDAQLAYFTCCIKNRKASVHENSTKAHSQCTHQETFYLSSC